MQEEESTLPQLVERTFARRMLELRQRRGWPQAELSARLDQQHQVRLDTGAITRLEKHAQGDPKARVLRLGEAAAIADVLDTTLADMLNPAPSAEEDIAQAAAEAARADERAAHAQAAYMLASAQARAAGTKLLQLKGVDVSRLLEDSEAVQELIDRTRKQAQTATRLRHMVEQGELDYSRPLAEQGLVDILDDQGPRPARRAKPATKQGAAIDPQLVPDQPVDPEHDRAPRRRRSSATKEK